MSFTCIDNQLESSPKLAGFVFISLADMKEFISPTVLLDFIYSAETLRVMEVIGTIRAVLSFNCVLYYVLVNGTFCFYVSICVKTSGRISVYGKF